MTAIPNPAPMVPGRLEHMSTRIAFFIAGFGIAAWAPLVPYAKARAGHPGPVAVVPGRRVYHRHADGRRTGLSLWLPARTERRDDSALSGPAHAGHRQFDPVADRRSVPVRRGPRHGRFHGQPASGDR